MRSFTLFYGKKAKFHIGSWDKVRSPVVCGGLGVRNLRIFNKALLKKWFWRYHWEREALWRVVIDYMYGSIKKDGV